MFKQAKSEYVREINRLHAEFPDIPMEAIVKQDVLRLGVRFTKDSLRIASGYKPKDYFIFSFDLRNITRPGMYHCDRNRSTRIIKHLGHSYFFT